MIDTRTWLNDEACFTTRIDIWTVHAEEIDLLELGPRAAVKLLDATIRESEFPHVWIRPVARKKASAS